MPENHHHRASGLRQSNKRNKRSKSSKRSLSRNAGGKVAGGPKRGTAMSMAAQSKADRKNMAQQKRDMKRQEMMRKKRFPISTTATTITPTLQPTRLIGIISLSSNQFQLEHRTLLLLSQGADKVFKPFAEGDENATVTCHYEMFKRDGRITYVTTNSFLSKEETNNRDVLAALDMARVCDMILFVIDGNTPKVEEIREIRISTDDHHSMTNTQASRTSRTVTQDWDHLISKRGDRILTALKGQGLPTPVTVLANTEEDPADGGMDHMTVQSSKSLHRSKTRRALDIKKYIHRFAITEFGTQNDKVLEVNFFDKIDSDNEDDLSMDGGKSKEPQPHQQSDISKLIRTICTMACSPAKWVALSPRSYIVSDKYEYNAEQQELRITGYIRGIAPFDVNSLIHIPNLGTYACKSVERAINPFTAARRSQSKSSSMDVAVTEEDGNNEVIYSDPTMREDITMYATPDALDGEQNLIGFDEADDNDDDASQDKTEKIARPAGWSDYQASWLGDDNGAGSIIGLDGDDDVADFGELADELNRKPSRGVESKTSDVGGQTDTMMDIEDANHIDFNERNALIQQRKKQQSEDLEFPDEVQVDDDEKAFERYARYRSLKSFRKSVWDPKENLPETYSNIFHFSSFKQTQRSVMNDMKELIREADVVSNNLFWGSSSSEINKSSDETMDDDDSNESNDEEENYLKGCVPRGSYVTITLENVPEEVIKNDLCSTSLLTAVTLLQHENKVSVLHMGLSQTAACDSTKENPVKSKDVLTFRCGWRTWKARPTFSQVNLNCDKHKFERYLPIEGAFFAASVFGPVTYTPCPVLVFRDNDFVGGSFCDGSERSELVSIGSMIGADADRIVVKRIVLTGYPVRVHKRFATVKYMFYNPEDVKWFKPAGLYTKHGLQGNIIQSVGEHGTMKCLFNAPIKQHDTVCLPLYKRIFPKYAPLEGEKEPATIRVL